METRYQIVGTENDRDMMTLAELESIQTVTGKETSPHLRPELRDQPIIGNMCGPMWGGWRDAAGEYVFLENDRDPTSPPKTYSKGGPIAYAVVRYETWEAYERLSR
jgi:hypothetical protein